MEIWDEQLADYGSKIMRKRQQFITQLQAMGRGDPCGDHQ